MKRIEDLIQQKSFTSEYQKVVINLTYTVNWINGRMIQILKPFGISPEQYNVLRILRGQYPRACSVSDIRQRMLNQNSNASRLIEKLKDKEMLTRTESSGDRRLMDVMITQKGLDVLHQLDAEVQSFHTDLQNISETDARFLNQLLDRLRG